MKRLQINMILCLALIGVLVIAVPQQVMAAGTNPQKKHLLQSVVKKVLVHDRRTVEIWYGLPNSPSVCTPDNLAPRRGLEPRT